MQAVVLSLQSLAKPRLTIHLHIANVLLRLLQLDDCHKVCYCTFILVANRLIKFTAHSVVTFLSVIFVCTVSTKPLVHLDVITWPSGKHFQTMFTMTKSQ